MQLLLHPWLDISTNRYSNKIRCIPTSGYGQVVMISACSPCPPCFPETSSVLRSSCWTVPPESVLASLDCISPTALLILTPSENERAGFPGTRRDGGKSLFGGAGSAKGPRSAMPAIMLRFAFRLKARVVNRPGLPAGPPDRRPSLYVYRRMDEPECIYQWRE